MSSMFASHTLITGGTFMNHNDYQGFRGAYPSLKIVLYKPQGFVTIGRKPKHPSPCNRYSRVSQLGRKVRSSKMSSEHPLGRSYQDHEMDQTRRTPGCIYFVDVWCGRSWEICHRTNHCRDVRRRDVVTCKLFFLKKRSIAQHC